MPTIYQAVAALEINARRIESAKLELEAAKAEKRELERKILPPLFTAARSKSFTLENGTRATKRMGCWARFPSETAEKLGSPDKKATIAWLTEIGHESDIRAKVEATWGKGDYAYAEEAFKHLSRDHQAVVRLSEDVNWATYQKIILETVRAGKHVVPFDDINAEVYDEVTITTYGDEPTEAK